MWRASLGVAQFRVAVLREAGGDRSRCEASVTNAGAVDRTAPAIHLSARVVYYGVMAVSRINVTLDDEYAARLTQLAERLHVQEGTVARSLLSQALEEVDPEPRHIADLLNRIPGARERIAEGLADLDAGLRSRSTSCRRT